jgi:hypothetical protein
MESVKLRRTYSYVRWKECAKDVRSKKGEEEKRRETRDFNPSLSLSFSLSISLSSAYDRLLWTAVQRAYVQRRSRCRSSAKAEAQRPKAVQR